MSHDIISDNCAPVVREVGVPTNVKDIDSMYLVGMYGCDWYGANVELFAHVPGGPAEVVFVYSRASLDHRTAAKKYAADHGLPIIWEDGSDGLF
jgi:hypothetical protein